MPSKKKKYNARFPPARIKKIMQSDEEVGKVAQAVPVIISRALELFVQSLLTKAESVTTTRNAKTLTPSHLKACILAESRFDFLKDLVATVPDVQGEEEMAVATPSTSTPLNAASSPFVFPPQSHANATPSNFPVPVAVDTVPEELPAYAAGLDIPPRPNHFIGNAAGVTGNPYVPSYSNNGGPTGDH